MKKANFIALVLWVISGFMFSIGLWAALLPEWNARTNGIVLGVAGIILALVTLIIWRKLTGKERIKVSAKSILAVFIGIAGALLFGTGMCFAMIWDRLSTGIVISLAGIAILLSLIPIVKGIEE